MTDTPERPKARHEWPKLAIDVDEYLHFLEECDWTDDEKREFIETLWQIVISFVDLEFRVQTGPTDKSLKTIVSE